MTTRPRRCCRPSPTTPGSTAPNAGGSARCGPSPRRAPPAPRGGTPRRWRRWRRRSPTCPRRTSPTSTPTDASLCSEWVCARASALLWAGRLTEAEDAARLALPYAERGGNEWNLLDAWGVLALVDVVRGRLSSAAETITSALSFARTRMWLELPQLVPLHLADCYIRLSRGDLPGARHSYELCERAWHWLPNRPASNALNLLRAWIDLCDSGDGRKALLATEQVVTDSRGHGALLARAAARRGGALARAAHPRAGRRLRHDRPGRQPRRLRSRARPCSSPGWRHASCSSTSATSAGTSRSADPAGAGHGAQARGRPRRAGHRQLRAAAAAAHLRPALPAPRRPGAGVAPARAGARRHRAGRLEAAAARSSATAHGSCCAPSTDRSRDTGC